MTGRPGRTQARPLSVSAFVPFSPHLGPGQAIVAAVQTRPLGRSGFEVSALGAGTGGLDASRWRDRDPAEGARTLREALDAGISFIAAPPAPARQVERLIGEVVRELRARDQAVVATPIPAAAGERLEQAFPVDQLVRSVEDSLRAQRTEALGVAQLGRWSDRWLETRAWEELRGVMARLITEGKVRSWGLIADDPKATEGVLADPAITSVQLRLHLLDRGRLALVGRAAEHELGVIACAPLGGGLLGGPITPAAAFPIGDWRKGHVERLDWKTLGPRLDRLRELSRSETETLPELAVRWCVGQAGVTTVVCGMRQRAHLHENVAAADGRALSAALLARLDEVEG